MAPLGSAADEVARLRDCLNDLVSITALPALSTGGEPGQIVRTLLDTLFGTLRLAFVMCAVERSRGRDFHRDGASRWIVGRSSQEREISKAIDSSLGDVPAETGRRAHGCSSATSNCRLRPRIWDSGVSSAAASPDLRGAISRQTRRGSFSMSPRTRRPSACSTRAS